MIDRCEGVVKAETAIELVATDQHTAATEETQAVEILIVEKEPNFLNLR